MQLKLIGAVLVIVGCGSVGFRIAAAHRREETMLRGIVSILEFMECELQYRLTPLPQLCRGAAKEGRDALTRLFQHLSSELESQISPDTAHCMAAVLSTTPNIPEQSREMLLLLGRSLGRFDLEGQLKGLESVRTECRRRIEALSENRDIRLRSYQTLGLCAGAALAILFI